MSKPEHIAGVGAKLLQFVVIFKQQRTDHCEWCGKKLNDSQHCLNYCHSCHGMGMVNNHSCGSCHGSGVVCSVHKVNWV